MFETYIQDIDTLKTCHLCNDSDLKTTGHVASNKSVHLHNI